MSIRFLIGSANQKHGTQLAKFLVAEGHRVLGIMDDSYELLRKVHTLYPDFVVIDGHMNGMNCSQICEVLVNDKMCPVIALISNADKTRFINLEQEMIFKGIIKPLRKNDFLNTIELLYRSFKQVKQLEEQVKKLSAEVDQNNIVAQAKKVLMNKYDLTEDEAHRKIQKDSMDRGIAKKKLAKIILMEN